MALSDQVPLLPGFDRFSTGDDVLADQEVAGLTAIVTGGYSGIGLETTRALARKGARVIVPVRSEQKAADALRGVDGTVRTLPLDLGDLASVRAFTDIARAELNEVDLLINNAGIMACPETRLGPGWEAQFAVNHLGHLALTIGLLPLLEAADTPRVVSLTSGGHKLSGIRWDDVHFERSEYDKWIAYGQAKTANALFANALSRRLEHANGSAFSVHPGGIFTPLQRHLQQEEMVAFGWLDEDGQPSALAREGFKTPEQGCSTTLWAATSPLLDGKPGVYCEDCDVAAPTDPTSEYARYFGVDAHACDDQDAERLWELSEALLADA